MIRLVRDNVFGFEEGGATSCGSTWMSYRQFDIGILLRNLAVAGAMTATWRHGLMTGGQSVLDCQHYTCYWHPGCGREVPR